MLIMKAQPVRDVTSCIYLSSPLQAMLKCPKERSTWLNKMCLFLWGLCPGVHKMAATTALMGKKGRAGAGSSDAVSRMYPNVLTIF